MIPRNKMTTLVFALWLLGLFVSIKNPVFLQYSNTIKYDYTANTETSESNLTKLYEMIPNIPYKKVSGAQSLLLGKPSNLYKRTFLQGYGNCTNFIEGFIWYSLTYSPETKFTILNFFPKESFILGFGHAVISNERTFDIVQGNEWIGLNGMALSVSDVFNRKKGDNFKIKKLNSKSETKDNYHKAIFLDNYLVGFSKSSDYETYFTFSSLEAFSVLPKTFKKYVTDGSALLLGILPEVTITVSKKELFGKYLYPAYFLQAWLLFTRLLIILTFILIAKGLWKVIQNFKRN